MPVSCITEQAKILLSEAEANHLDNEAKIERSRRWYSCSLCEQEYHGVVRCALSWACWKTYLGRLEADWPRRFAINQLGNGLSQAKRHNEALTVRKTELAMMRRLGASEHNLLLPQANLANTYARLGRFEQAAQMDRDVYSGWLRLKGEEHEHTIHAANNYAKSLKDLSRFEEAKALLRKTIPLARRVLGEGRRLTLKMRWTYSEALYADRAATLDDLREAVSMLEDAARTARRVLGGAHPVTTGIETTLHNAQAKLRARETPPTTV